jgi:RNA polymerase sigma-70 factor (ECF subfamily)
MYGVCLRYAKDQDEAEDLLQESFIRAFKNIGQFNATGALGAWLRKVTVNVCLENYRKNKTTSEHLKNYCLEYSEELDLDNALSCLALENLIQKIQQLPTGYRTIFNLYAIEGFNHVEIAEMLQISIGTSKSQYSRAKQILREILDREAQLELKLLNYARQ